MKDNDTISGMQTIGGPMGAGAADWNDTLSGLATEGGAERVVLAGRYRVVKRLGEGGMGSVWLAEDGKLDGRKVAIKMLPAVLATKKGAYKQVKAEALVAMKLAHPNIATVRAFEEDEGGSPFLVMDYIEGEGLDDILAERGPLSEAETLKLLGPVAAALDYAHGKGVVHRDVKPGNVMVTKEGTPFVLDFGIAREIQETMTRVTGKLSSGTLLYMSPEQLNGDRPRAAQDVYSFAAMAYECLAGEPPFCRGAIEDQIKHKTPEALPEGVGATLREGVTAGLAKEAGARPGSCAEVLGQGEAARRARAAREAEEARRRQAEEALRAQEERRRREEEEARRRREAEALAALEAEEQRRLSAEKARAAAEAVARRARLESVARELEAQQEKEARGRTAGWAWFWAVALVVAAVAGAAWWQSDREGLLKKWREERNQKAQLEQNQSDWEQENRNLRRQLEDAQKAKTAAVQELAQKQADWDKKQLDWQKQLEEAKKAPEVPRTPAQEKPAPAKPVAAKPARGEWDGAYTGADRTVDLPHGEKMTLRWCPAGTFTMGSPVGEEGRLDGEVQHEVELTRGFWMAETEVTQGQWKALMGGETVKDLARKALQDDTEYDFDDGQGTITMRERWNMQRGDDPGKICPAIHDDAPVYNVSWSDAKEFCRRLTEKGRNEGWLPAGYNFRLPTEAEWEYACRAGTKTALPNGQDSRILGENNAPALDDIAWYGGNSSVGLSDQERGTTWQWDTAKWPEKQYPGGMAAVRLIKGKLPNHWGLYDMIGNVWEWCEDENAKYPTEKVKDPWMRNDNTALGVRRILRGGGWDSYARRCRSADRGADPAGRRCSNIGFRPVCSAGLSW